MMMLFSEHADVSVRPAIPGDAQAFVAIQLDAWQANLAGVVSPELRESFDESAIEAQWKESIQAPAGQGLGVLTALKADKVVGFVAVAPATIVALEVSPEYWRQGHGSRLLTAAVDRLRRDGSTQFSVWVPATATGKQEFYASAGLARDGRVRHLGVSEGVEVVEERWAADL